MKFKIDYLIIIFLIFTFHCHKPVTTENDPWIKINSPFEGQQLRAIQFISKDTGYILGLNIVTDPANRYNALLKSTDGGKTWQQQIFPPPEAGGVGLLFAYSSQLIFTAKDGIFKSTDGGVSWSVPDSDFNRTGNLTRGIHFFDSQNGLAINGGEVYKTVDGGEHFTTILYDSSGAALRDLKVISNTVFVWGGTGNLLKSSDRGNSWIKLAHDGSMATSFVTEKIGYGLQFQNIFKTTDGGVTWVKTNAEPVGKNDIGKLLFANVNDGFIITISGEIYHSSDGGKNWKLEHSEPLQLNDITINGNNEIFVVGEKNLILSRKLY